VSDIGIAIDIGNCTEDFPTDNPFSTTATYGVSTPPGCTVLSRSYYVAVSGSYDDTFFTLGSAQGNPNAPPNSTLNWGYPKYKGLFNYKVNASIARVPDGTSNTLMFGEISGGQIGLATFGGTPAPFQGPPCDGWLNPGFMVNPFTTAFGACPDRTNPNCEFDSIGLGLNAQTFGSFHAGPISNYAFADGSVRPLKTNIDFGLFLALGGYNDGDVINDLQ